MIALPLASLVLRKNQCSLSLGLKIAGHSGCVSKTSASISFVRASSWSDIQEWPHQPLFSTCSYECSSRTVSQYSCSSSLISLSGLSDISALLYIAFMISFMFVHGIMTFLEIVPSPWQSGHSCSCRLQPHDSSMLNSNSPLYTAFVFPLGVSASSNFATVSSSSFMREDLGSAITSGFRQLHEGQ